jgi:hypothetical protein
MALTTAGNGINASAVNCSQPAGVRALYIADAADITAVSLASTGDFVCTSIAPSAQFEEIQFKSQQCQITETMEKNEFGNSMNTIEIEADVTKFDKTQRRAFDEINKKCNLVGVAYLYDGRFMLIGVDNNLGVDGVRFESTGFEQTHERGIEGGNYAILRFQAMQTEPMYEYDGSGDSATTAALKVTWLKG